ncbi:MAG TPA: DUF1027 domain-containing protein [Lactobacillus sp.]|nr:DUF1027 domain-containing protein [Lactobacillus sp.]
MATIDREHIQELAQIAQEKRAAMFTVVRENEQQFFVNGHPYELVTNFHDAFDVHKFAERYSTVLSKYDYLVGDWGFDQLRLKGFYAAHKRNAAEDQTITALQDYLYEYCNFGCAYFVLHNLDVEIEQQDQPQKEEHQRTHRSRRRRNNSSQSDKVNATRTAGKTSQSEHKTSNSHKSTSSHRHQFETRHKPETAYTKERTVKANARPIANSGQQVTTSQSKRPSRRHFTIRQKSHSSEQTTNKQ